MAEDSTPAPENVELDAEGRQLQLEAEKAKYLETIAQSRQSAARARTPSLTSLLPTAGEVPKGQVVLGDRAGALGPWRAHQLLDTVAAKIADAVVQHVPRPDGPATLRILVLDDRSVLEGDWTARQVTDTLARLTARLTSLTTQLVTVRAALAESVRSYEQAQDEQTRPPAPEPTGTRGSWRAPSGSEPPTLGAAAAGAVPVGVTGALGGAVDLLSLLRTDYTLTASTVSAGPAELVTLTTARLAAAGVVVEADVFSTAPMSATRTAFTALLRRRDEAADALAGLRGELAPVESELAAVVARVGIIEKEWTAQIRDLEAAGALRGVGNELAQQARQRAKAAAPARAFLDTAAKALSEVDAAVTTLTKAPEGAESPLFTAARRERLAGAADAGRITHVLYVNLDVLAADTVTRRSLLGTSGVVRFLSAGNASWLLLDPVTGTVTAGGQEEFVDLLTLGLTTGKAAYAEVPGGLERLASRKIPKDPLARLELPAALFVAALALILVVVGTASVLAVVRLAFG